MGGTFEADLLLVLQLLKPLPLPCLKSCHSKTLLFSRPGRPCHELGRAFASTVPLLGVPPLTALTPVATCTSFKVPSRVTSVLTPQRSQAELVGVVSVTQGFAVSWGITVLTVLTSLISVIHCVIKLYNCIVYKPVSPTRP